MSDATPPLGSLDEMILVSVDDHLIEPPDTFERRLPESMKSRAPRLVRKQDGSEVWVFEGKQHPSIGLNAVAGRPPEEYGMEPTSFEQMREGCFDSRSRVDDMNVNGVLGSLCFPSVTGLVGQLFLDQARASSSDRFTSYLVSGYNDWHIEDWCGSHPGRFIPLAIPPIWDPHRMADEVRRVGRKGCHAITFPDSPTGLGLPSVHSDHWDPFWKACADEGTVVCIHIGSGTGMNLQDREAPIEIMIATTPITLFGCATELVYSDALRKFPDLRIALSEGGIGWVPYLLERLDYVHEHHHPWTHHRFPDGKRPSDVFRDHFITCFIDDEAGIAMRHRIGLENITWECDYPHSDSTWPRSPEQLWRSIGDLPADEVHAITWRNACRHFRFDPFAHVPRERATVGALRAEAARRGVDTRPRSGRGGKPPQDLVTRHVTIGDVVAQLAGAYSTPFESNPGAG